MKKYYKYLLVLAIFTLFGFGFWNLKTKNSLTTIQNERVVQTGSATLTVDDGKTNPKFNIAAFIGKTVLETTDAELNHNLQMTGSGQNAFITSLNGRTADPKKREFWELDVNGKEASVGAGTLIVQNNDQIEW